MASMEVKLCGGRFEEKFTELFCFDKDLYKHDIVGSRGHASMLARQGLITEDDKNSILKGLDEIVGQIERGEFVCRTDREDVHMNIEAAPTDLVAEPAKKLHTARSRNDQNLLVELVKLALKNEGLRLIVPGYTHLQRAQPVLLQHLFLPFVEQNLLVELVKLALKNEGLRLIVLGYTHLQRAQPVLLQHLFLAFVEQLALYAGRLLDCRKRMNFFPLGACAFAFAGTDLPIDRFLNPEALGSIAPMRTRPNKDNDEGSCGGGGGGNDKDNDEGSCEGGRGRNGIWIRTLAGAGIVIGGVVGMYFVYKTGQAIEREIVGAVRDWKEAGFPALVNIKIEKVGLKFSIY